MYIGEACSGLSLRKNRETFWISPDKKGEEMLTSACTPECQVCIESSFHVGVSPTPGPVVHLSAGRRQTQLQAKNVKMQRDHGVRGVLRGDINCSSPL